MLQTVCALIVLPAFVPTPDKPAPLTGLPPLIHAVSGVDAGKGVVLVEKTVIEAVPVQEAYTVNINGQAVTQVRTVYKTVQKVVTLALPVKDGKVQNAGGKDLSAGGALKRLKAGMPILISADGNPVSPGYLAIFQPDTIVLIPPAPAIPSPPPPLPGPK